MVLTDHKKKKRRESQLKNLAKQVKTGLIDEFPSYTGGHTTTHNGYVWELYSSHPKSNVWGYFPQHRLIAELVILKRPLNSNEVVHHIDENRVNNSIENLQVMTQYEHRSHHAKMMSKRMEIPLDEADVASALEKYKAVKPAAAALGVNHQTLRNRFADLCEPFQRTSPVSIDEDPYLDQIRIAAEDSSISLKMLGERLKISVSTILRICDRNKIDWQRKGKTGYKHCRQRKGKTLDATDRQHYQNQVQIVRDAAKCPEMSLREIASELNTSTSTIRRICQDNDIVWLRKSEKSEIELDRRRRAIASDRRIA